MIDDPDFIRKAEIEADDIRRDENESTLRWREDTVSTTLIRTADDVLHAMRSLDDAGIRCTWSLDLLWLGNAKDMGDYHAVVEAYLPSHVATAYQRKRWRGKGAMPRVGDMRALLLTKEQVAAVIDAVKAADEELRSAHR